jgi:hypothetical protein
MFIKVLFWVAVGLTAVTAVLTARARRISARTKVQVDAWAQHSQFRLLRATRHSAFGTPFSWSPAHAVYQVTVDDHGRTRHGWLRCGKPPENSPKYARVEVRWND